MKLNDRFQKIDLNSGSDGMGGSLTGYVLNDLKLFSCSLIHTSKEYVSKTFNVELLEPMLLITNQLLDPKKDYLLIANVIYSIKVVNNVKNKPINSYILDKVGDFIGNV